MIRSALALSQTLVVADARPCAAGSGHGYMWRNRSLGNMHVMNVKFAATTTKRPTRHLGIATT